MDMREIVLGLSDVGGVCFGQFTLKSGISSPIYVDLRTAIARPQLMTKIASSIWDVVRAKSTSVDIVCGVPTGAIPLATCVSQVCGLPMVICRKEVKDYGRQKAVEGKFTAGQRCLLIEDILVSGQSIMETVQVLRKAGLDVVDAVVFLDREQGGRAILEKEGITVHSPLSISQMLQVLHEEKRIIQEVYEDSVKFIESTKLTALPRHLQTAKKARKLSYEARENLSKHPLSKQLFRIMASKKTNLALSADVETCQELLKISDQLGPYICLLKTHVDCLKDFSSESMEELVKLATKHSFLIFEDRKFADIGNTVRVQYEGGSYRIADWAHIINAHPLPGSGIIDGLKSVGSGKGAACVLVAQMSSRGHLCSAEYIQKTIEMANRHKDFVIGFICTSLLTSDPEMLHMVPGVKLERGQDSLGQSYVSPEEAFERGADLIIVGRGILQAQDPVATARNYAQVGYEQYQRLLTDDHQ